MPAMAGGGGGGPSPRFVPRPPRHYVPIPPLKPDPPARSAPPSHTDVTSGGYNFGRTQAYERKAASQPPTHTDVTSSGGDYGSAKAQAYKKTPAYHKAVAEVFKVQSVPQQAAILNNLKHYSSIDPDVASALSSAAKSLPISRQEDIVSYLAPASAKRSGGLLSDIGKAADTSLGALGDLVTRNERGPTGLGTSQSGYGGAAGLVAKVPIDIARATVQSPAVIPKTLKGLGETAVGSAAALAELPVKVWQEGPIKAAKEIGKAAAKDYSSRYGPLVSGNDNAFIARIKKQGAAPELIDALGFAGGADATAGRAATQAAETLGRGGKIARALTEARPALRISGTEMRDQELAKTAGRAMAQRLEDKLRKARKSTLPLAEHEIQPLTRLHNYNHAMRELVSRVSARHRYLMQQTIGREVRHGAEPAFRHLSSAEQKAAMHVVEGEIPLRSGSAAARQAIQDKIDAIIAERARNPSSPGNRIPEAIAGKVDNVAQLRQLLGNVDEKGNLKWLTPGLADWQAGEAARNLRIEGELPGSYLRQSTAEARRLRAQGEKFGIPHPMEVHEAGQREAAALEAHALRDAPKTVADAERSIKRINGKLADARRREAVVVAKLKAGKGLAEPEGLAAAKRTERAAHAAVREREAQLARARQREEVLLARHGGIRGGYRGRTDITGEPLPKGTYAGIDRAQRQRAFAEERLRAAKVDRGTAISRRVELERLNRHELPLPAESAERVFRHQRQTAALEDALTQAQRELKSSKEYGRYAEGQARRGPKERKAEYLADREGLLREYSARVRERAQHEGLPEPAFMRHQALPQEDLTAYTSGQGAIAQSGPKQSGFHLHRGGAVNRDPHAYFDSLARGIRAAHQWRLVDEQFRRNALPTPSAEAIHTALGESKHPSELTGHELKQVLLHQGVDLNHIRFYNPGRLSETTLQDASLARGSRAGTEPHELEASSDLYHELGQERTSVDGRKVDSLRDDEPFMRAPGWKALPRAAYDEIHSGLKPSGLGGRLIGKAQGATAAGILGLSPSFVIMNTLAHAYLATAGTRGRILTDSLKFPFWWHGLTDAERDVVRSHAGGRGDYRLERMGATAPEGIRASWHDLQRKGIMRMVGHANPIRAMFKAEDLQSNFFRHMTYYSAAKRTALHNITSDMGPATAAAAKLNHALNIGPKDEMSRLLQSQHAAEELGRYTINMMGDYARFTSHERKYLNNRAVLFYSFLRHATRTLLYVLPVKHPIATALVGELAKLHNDEVKKMLGGADLPWAYSRLFFKHGDGKLSSIDLMRSSPIGGAVPDIASEGVRGLSGLVAPELQPVLDMMYGQTIDGQKVNKNVFQGLSDYLSLSYPYRLAKDLRFGTKPQTPESIPFLHERAKVYAPTSSGKPSKAAQYAAAKAKALGPEQQRLLAGALGVYPKPDDSIVIAGNRNAKAAAHQRNLAKKAGKGGSGVVAPSGASATAAPSGGSGFFGPSTTTSSGGGGSGFFGR